MIFPGATVFHKTTKFLAKGSRINNITVSVMREIVNAKQTQVHPGNPSQGWLRRLCLCALSLPGRIAALPE